MGTALLMKGLACERRKGSSWKHACFMISGNNREDSTAGLLDNFKIIAYSHLAIFQGSVDY